MDPRYPTDRDDDPGQDPYWSQPAPTRPLQAPQQQGQDPTALYPGSYQQAPYPDDAHLLDYDRPEPRFGDQRPHDPRSDATRNAIMIMAGTILLIALIALVTYIALLVRDRGGESVVAVVPTVIGETQATATNRLTDAGFSVTVEFRESEEGEPGTVFAQIPEAGTEHDVTEPVVLFVVAGEETVVVPNVVDRQAGAAQSELAALGFVVSIVEEPSEGVDLGRVIRQSIEPGQEANAGTEITLTVSSGPSEIEVPNVVNQSQANAERLLVDAGLIPRVELVDVQPDSGSVGNVVAQSPAPQQPIAPGSQVLIQVGRAATTTTSSSTTTTTTTESTTTTTTTTTTTAPTTTATTEPSTSTTTTTTEATTSST